MSGSLSMEYVVSPMGDHVSDFWAWLRPVGVAKVSAEGHSFYLFI